MVDRIFVTRKIPEIGLEMLKKEFAVDIWKEQQPPSSEEIIRRAKNCHGLITLLSDPINKELIEQLPRLKMIAQYAVGYDNIDIEAATEEGILVSNTPGVLTETTADLTWALIFASARRIPEADRYVREGEWKVAWGPEMLLGKDIYGATLGIVGLGRIGTAVAKRAKGFSMKVIYSSKSETELTRVVEDELGAEPCELEELLRKSDIVTLHVPLTDETEGMIGNEQIAMMPKGSILINTSRGAVVDQRALIEALERGHLFSAGLDVFQEEPLESDSKLLKLTNVVLAPHIGSASFSTRAKMAEICARNMIQGLSDEIPDNLVNPQVLVQSKQ
ncbi:MAG: Glyoxylate reductase [Candidatus Thorarchaeota archaeon]|nr:MAG: Glyoxylate reductase [Candidatus Thorarchaeota archaeon]